VQKLHEIALKLLAEFNNEAIIFCYNYCGQTLISSP